MPALTRPSRRSRNRTAAVGAALLAAAAFAASPRDQVTGTFERPPHIEYRLEGVVGKRLKANLENWELRAPGSNPALVRMFYDRDRKPGRRLEPWGGEFIGKHLNAAILSYRFLRDPRQKILIDELLSQFLRSQDPDGYLGPFERTQRLTGRNWDVWGHYWAIRALLLYHEEFNSPEALAAATRAADLIIRTFREKNIPMTNDGSFGQMNYASIHAFTKLYRVTGKPEYLEMARWIAKQWDKPGAGLYLRLALDGKEMFEFPGNRWESIHDFQGMYDLYLLTGDSALKQAFTQIWTSILKGDRHNTGGFTSGERTTGNPYDGGAIETCCTVAWVDMSTDMLALTGDSRVADELELSMFNGVLGAQHPSGSWWTYNTPMDGERRASAHQIVFQARAGSPELNCCSVNGPRGLALLSEWAVLRSSDGIVLNYYGPGAVTIPVASGQKVRIEQTTKYPADGVVQVRLVMERPETMTLRLRIPAWSERSSVSVNGVKQSVKAGAYLAVRREWKTGDAIDIAFDMSPHFWAGERELDGRGSIYYGPLLLAFDPTYNSIDLDNVPELDAARVKLTNAAPGAPGEFKPWVLFGVEAQGGTIHLCDFATAGAYGNPYRTWFLMKGLPPPAAFDPRRPVWAMRPAAQHR